MKWSQVERDAAVREVVAAGVTLREVTKIVGLGHRRIAQIVKEH